MCVLDAASAKTFHRLTVSDAYTAPSKIAIKEPKPCLHSGASHF